MVGGDEFDDFYTHIVRFDLYRIDTGERVHQITHEIQVDSFDEYRQRLTEIELRVGTFIAFNFNFRVHVEELVLHLQIEEV